MNIFMRCQCGSLRGEALHVSRNRRVVCMCDDCQAFAHYLGTPKEVLDQNGGTDILPMAPAHVKISEGLEHLRAVRLTEKGLIRWYAGCCRTPIANSPPNSKTPYVGLIHTALDLPRGRDEILGPVSGRIQARYGIGPLPKGSDQTVSLKIIFKTILFLLSSAIRRLHKPSPFFISETGQPVVAPKILTTDEREVLRKFCGPRPTAISP